MLQYGHQISGRPLSPSGGSVADTGCSRRIQDVLGAKGNGGVPTRSLRAAQLGTERRWREGIGGEEDRCSDACVAALGRG
jgi:hypothetical protein